MSTSNHKIAFSSVWPSALHIVFAYAGRKGKTVCFLSFRVTGYTATTQSLGNFRNMVVLCVLCTCYVRTFTTPFFLSMFCVITILMPLKMSVGISSSSSCTRAIGSQHLKRLSVTMVFIIFAPLFVYVSTVIVGCSSNFCQMAPLIFSSCGQSTLPFCNSSKRFCLGTQLLMWSRK